MVKFSLIVPVYNVEKYLRRCFESIVKQTYTDYEVIIVCDKSNDNSEAIVDEYVKKYNYQKIYKEKTGLSEARNIGVLKAKGKYLLFLDSDDFLENDLLEVLNQNLDDEPDLIRFQIKDVKEDGTIINHREKAFSTIDGIQAFNTIITYHYVEVAWSYCYNRKFYQQNKFKFMKNCIAEDYGLIPLVIAKAKKVKSLAYMGYNYVIRNNSLMTDKSYDKKIKKLNDMLKQADYLKKEFVNISNNERFMSFINNSLIYYITTFEYRDYKKYKKILKEKDCFSHLKAYSLKTKFRCFLIKHFTYFFYHFIAR